MDGGGVSLYQMGKHMPDVAILWYGKGTSQFRASKKPCHYSGLADQMLVESMEGKFGALVVYTGPPIQTSIHM